MEKLVLVSYMGESYDGLNCYEFVFSQTPYAEAGNNWTVNGSDTLKIDIPKKVISSIKILRTEIDLSLAGEQPQFVFLDAVKGIIPLAWEAYDPDIIDKVRMVFHYGIAINEVESELRLKRLAFQ